VNKRIGDGAVNKSKGNIDSIRDEINNLELYFKGDNQALVVSFHRKHF
jgi:hypothetical protein